MLKIFNICLKSVINELTELPMCEKNLKNVSQKLDLIKKKKHWVCDTDSGGPLVSG